jgi:hypothetical protein
VSVPELVVNVNLETPVVVVVDAVSECGVLTHCLGTREGSDWNDVKVTKVPAQPTRWHDDHPFPGVTTELANRRILWTDTQLSLLAHLVETRLAVLSSLGIALDDIIQEVFGDVGQPSRQERRPVRIELIIFCGNSVHYVQIHIIVGISRIQEGIKFCQ